MAEPERVDAEIHHPVLHVLMRNDRRADASLDVGACTYEPVVRTTRPLTSDPVGGDVEDACTRGLDNDDSKAAADLNCLTPADQRRLDWQRESRRACTGNWREAQYENAYDSPCGGRP